ncbi:hypothetical protein L596_024743 [Steinernema carpocapsae]|uniref:Uncharacterized protein n=1 Tax=Steinernema carpocapsae TaxID=34508 RepID=A0A4U5M5M2_STECR|nr:hypothetical protein L596_024743 [Steinernema carpocapsae]
MSCSIEERLDEHGDVVDPRGNRPEPINPVRNRFPYCIVWVPIPLISWFFPFIGHIGIANSRGIIRDFSGSRRVNEDDMGFGWPLMYWQLDPRKVAGGAETFDRAISDAAEEYKDLTHNFIVRNCHSFVARALCLMAYNRRTNYNQVNLWCWMSVLRKPIGWFEFVLTWLPFVCILVFGGLLTAFFVFYA